MSDPSTPPTDAQASAGSGAEPDYASLLDNVPEEYLLRHRRVNGLVGSHAQRLAERQRESDQAEARVKADREAEDRILKLAEDDPFTFSQHYLQGKAKERQELEMSQLRTNAQKKLFERVGQSYGQLAEWKTLTPEEFAQVSQSVNGVAEDDMLPAFNAAALDMLANKRAASRMDAQFKERLASEVEVALQERLAARMRGDTSPDMSLPSSGVGAFDPRSMSDQDFDRWYKRRFGV